MNKTVSVVFFTEEDADRFLDELRHRKTIVVENIFGNHRFDIAGANRIEPREHTTVK